MADSGPTIPDESRRVLRPPQLGGYLRGLRESRDVSRELAASRLRISGIYLAQIELGMRVPTKRALQTLPDAYGLDEAQRRHVEALQEQSVDLPAPQVLRERIERASAMMERLRDLDSAGLIAAYFDPAWTVLAANEEFRRALPGLAEAEVGAVWWFGPTARELLIDWEREALLHVRFLKADLARYRNSARTTALLRVLERDPDCYRLWTTDTHIAHGRGPEDMMHLRNGATDDAGVSSLSIQTSRLDSDNYVRYFLAFRKPYSGPDIR